MGMLHHDPFVTPFRADRATAWTQFRLGGGLNVVVESAALPSEFAWRVQTGPVSSSPVVLGSKILVASNDDHLYAIDAASGALRWRYRAENEIMSQPVYARGLIYVGIGNADATAFYPPHMSLVGSGINKIEAVDSNDGIEQWWGGLDGTGMPTQAIIGDTIVAADGNGTVIALSLRTGKYRWHAEFPTTFSMTSVADGGYGVVYMTGRYENAVYALRVPHAGVVWERRFGDNDGALGDEPLAVTKKSVVGVYLRATAPGPFGMPVTYDSIAQQHAFAIDRLSGRRLWDTTLPGVRGKVPPYNQAAIPLVYAGRIYAGSAIAPIVTSLDLHGRVLWQRRVDGSVKGGIVARDGVLYFGDHSGALWAIDARSGGIVGSVQTDMQFNTGSPIIVNETLIDGGTNDVIAVPLRHIRSSLETAGVTQLGFWDRVRRALQVLVPKRDPHREAGYYTWAKRN